VAVGTTAVSDLTRDQLIDDGFSEIGVNEITVTERADAVRKLNMLIRHLDESGYWLWAVDNTESSLTTVAGQSEYVTGALATNIPTNIVKLEWAAVLIGTKRDVVEILDKPLSLRTTLKDDNNSQPIKCHLERAKLLADNKLIVYPTPNSAYQFLFHFRRPLFDFTNPTDNPDFPSAFNLSLAKLLAQQLAPSYGIPLGERQILGSEGSALFKEVTAGFAEKPVLRPVKTEFM